MQFCLSGFPIPTSKFLHDRLLTSSISAYKPFGAHTNFMTLLAVSEESVGTVLDDSVLIVIVFYGFGETLVSAHTYFA